jgi:hypothetical protein
MRKRRATPAIQLKTVTDNRGGHRTPPIVASRATCHNADASTITVRVPLSAQQRGSRKLILTPPGEPDWVPRRARVDDTLINAIARAHRWNRMLEGGEYASVTELSKAEDVTESYLARILRLTLLSPKIVEAVLDGRSAGSPQLQQLVRPFSFAWQQQEAKWLRGTVSS